MYLIIWYLYFFLISCQTNKHKFRLIKAFFIYQILDSSTAESRCINHLKHPKQALVLFDIIPKYIRKIMKLS